MNGTETTLVAAAMGTFTGAYPPEDPFHNESWGGLVFERNLYPHFAPLNVWQALIDAAKGELALAIPVIRMPLTVDPSRALSWHSLSAVSSFLLDEQRFLGDYLFVGESGRWGALIDQDVTLFGAVHDVMDGIYSALGGVSSVRRFLADDFGWPDDDTHADSESDAMRRYFDRLVFLDQKKGAVQKKGSGSAAEKGSGSIS